MSAWTAVYISDDGTPYVFGRMSRDGAVKLAEKIERDLDEDRDTAGGGVGHAMACPIQPARAWGDDA